MCHKRLLDDGLVTISSSIVKGLTNKEFQCLLRFSFSEEYPQNVSESDNFLLRTIFCDIRYFCKYISTISTYLQIQIQMIQYADSNNDFSTAL